MGVVLPPQFNYPSLHWADDTIFPHHNHDDHHFHYNLENFQHTISPEDLQIIPRSFPVHNVDNGPQTPIDDLSALDEILNSSGNSTYGSLNQQPSTYSTPASYHNSMSLSHSSQEFCAYMPLSTMGVSSMSIQNFVPSMMPQALYIDTPYDQHEMRETTNNSLPSLHQPQFSPESFAPLTQPGSLYHYHPPPRMYDEHNAQFHPSDQAGLGLYNSHMPTRPVLPARALTYPLPMQAQENTPGITLSHVKAESTSSNSLSHAIIAHAGHISRLDALRSEFDLYRTPAISPINFTFTPSPTQSDFLDHSHNIALESPIEFAEKSVDMSTTSCTCQMPDGPDMVVCSGSNHENSRVFHLSCAGLQVTPSGLSCSSVSVLS